MSFATFFGLRENCDRSILVLSGLGSSVSASEATTCTNHKPNYFCRIGTGACVRHRLDVFTGPLSVKLPRTALCCRRLVSKQFLLAHLAMLDPPPVLNRGWPARRA